MKNSNTYVKYDKPNKVCSLCEFVYKREIITELTYAPHTLLTLNKLIGDNISHFNLNRSVCEALVCLGVLTKVLFPFRLHYNHEFYWCKAKYSSPLNYLQLLIISLKQKKDPIYESYH
jgi:hypothetical protein